MPNPILVKKHKNIKKKFILYYVKQPSHYYTIFNKKFKMWIYAEYHKKAKKLGIGKNYYTKVTKDNLVKQSCFLFYTKLLIFVS